MKNKILSVLITLLGSPSIQAQSQQNYNELDINNIRAGFFANGQLFRDTAQISEFEAPKGSGLSTIFTGALWIGGFDEGNKLHLAAQTYGQTGYDYWPGPLQEDGTTSEKMVQDWNQVWKVNRMEIEMHRLDYEDDGVINNITSTTILQWPGKGNPNLVIEMPDHELAPFVDIDNDGIYNPEKGDYPDIQGDQMLWWVFNDQRLRGESEAEPLGIEVQASAYAFNWNDTATCGIDSSMLNTIILDLKIMNQSSNNYDSVLAGLFMDFDLGGAFDDYIGSNPEKNSFYCYNGDSFDESFGEAKGYGAEIPMQIVKFLNKEMTHFMYYNNTINEPIGNPFYSFDYYNYLNSVWLDGRHLTYGGNGHDTTGSLPETNFIFPSSPNDASPSAWSECSEGNIVHDRRGVGSVGPLTLPSNESIELEIAFIFVPNVPYPCPAYPEVELNQELWGVTKNVKAKAEIDSEIRCMDSSIQFKNSALNEFDISYQWVVDGVDTGNSDTLNYTFSEDGTHNIQLKATGKCGADSSIQIIEIKDCDQYFFLPNAFSPNNDGYNDYFQSTSRNVSAEQISIYDTYGKMIYQNQIGAAINWDGTYKEKVLSSQVFVYQLTYEIDGETKKQMGNLTLVR